MLNAYFQTTGKRKNSTLQVDTSNAVNRPIQLLDPSSVINPVITLDDTNPTRYNYCYIPDLKRYYFINDWVWENGIWQASCSCDVLATWKSDIGVSYNYVLRSASSYDGTIVDNAYPILATATYAKNSASNSPFTDNWTSTGYFSVGLVNNSLQAFGATSYMLFSASAMKAFLSILLGNISIYDVSSDEISEELQKMLFNPSKYISSVVYLPFDLSLNTAFSTSDIPVGWWSLNIGSESANIVVPSNAKQFLSEFTISLTTHPQQAARGVYTNAAPYTTRCLVCWPFGEIPLDTSIMAEVTALYCQVYVDTMTGAGILYVWLDSSHTKLLLTRTAQVGVPCQIAQISTDVQSIVTGGLTTAVAAGVGAIEGFFGGGSTVSSVVNGIGTAVQASAAQLEVQGSTGSLIGYDTTPAVYSTFKGIANTANTEMGRPLCKRVQLSTLSGYILVNDPELVTSATQNETEQILSYMRSGFFYE